MTTEWEDVLVRQGIIAPREIERAPTDREYDEDSLREKEKIEKEQQNKLENRSLDELEDELDDDKILEEYRRKRLEEMRLQAQKNRFGKLIEISEVNYKDEVTNQPEDIWVIVFLHKPSIPHCQLLQQRLIRLAEKYPATKFVKIRSEEAIPNYPDKNLPTLLIYNKSDVVRQFIGLASMGGETLTIKDLAKRLQQAGALPKDDRLDDEDEDGEKSKIRKGYIARAFHDD